MELSVFTSISFSKQSAFWKVLELPDLCGLSTDSQKTYSVNRLVAVTKFRLGGLSTGSEKTEKKPEKFSITPLKLNWQFVVKGSPKIICFLDIQILLSVKIRPHSLRAFFWESF